MEIFYLVMCLALIAVVYYYSKYKHDVIDNERNAVPVPKLPVASETELVAPPSYLAPPADQTPKNKKSKREKSSKSKRFKKKSTRDKSGRKKKSARDKSGKKKSGREKSKSGKTKSKSDKEAKKEQGEN